MTSLTTLASGDAGAWLAAPPGGCCAGSGERRDRFGLAPGLRHRLDEPQPDRPARDPVQQAAEGERKFAVADVGRSPFLRGHGAFGLMDQVPDVHLASPW